MKRFTLTLCFVAFLSAGLVSCSDDAADVTPQREISSPEYTVDEPGSAKNNDKP